MTKIDPNNILTDNFVVVPHHCVRTFQAPTRHILHPIRLCCGDSSSCGLGTAELMNPQCVQCNEEFGVHRMFCPTTSYFGKRHANLIACRIMEKMFSSCLSVIARTDQVQCSECARVGVEVPVCRSCAPLAIMPVWQEYRRYDQEGKVGGEWIDVQRHWLPRRICKECWEQREKTIGFPHRRKGSLLLQPRIVDRRDFDFFQRSLYSKGWGIDLDAIESRVLNDDDDDDSIVSSSVKWSSSKKVKTTKHVEIAHALQEMNLAHKFDTVVLIHKITKLHQLRNVDSTQLLSMSFDRNERKRFTSWQKQQQMVQVGSNNTNSTT